MLTVGDIQKRIDAAQAELEQVHRDMMSDMGGRPGSGGIGGLAESIASLSKVTGITSKIEMLRSKIEVLELLKEIVEV